MFVIFKFLLGFLDLHLGSNNGNGSPREKSGDDNPNTIEGTKWKDALFGLGSNDILVGKRGKDVLDGGTGNDLLNGGVGADKLLGGDGSDTATYEDSCSGVTVNLASGLAKGGEAEGDSFQSIENLIGTDFNDSLTGDDGINVLNGLAGKDILYGGGGDDRLLGGLGEDTLWGGIGNDHLIGDTGTNSDYTSGAADTMYGGDGNDTYSVYQIGDTVVEELNEGTDIVLASVDYTLPSNVENMTLFNTAIRGSGNELPNKITGNANDNVINGKGGMDDLVGGAGADTFVFDAPNPQSRDVIRDFVSGVDKIGISVSGFSLEFAPGSTLPTDYFFVDPLKPASADPAQLAHGQFVLLHDSSTITSLYWDGDGGLSAQSPILLAIFTGGASPALSDFSLLA